MLRNGRPVINEFDDDERFFHRVEPALASLAHPDGKIDPIHMSQYQCVDLSSNRSRFSESWYVLYPRSQFGDFAVFKFMRQDLPPRISREGGGTYDLITEHVPEDDNYGHCETGVYREGLRMRKNQVKQDGKNKLRLLFARILTLERRAGLPFPPPQNPGTQSY